MGKEKKWAKMGPKNRNLSNVSQKEWDAVNDLVKRNWKQMQRALPLKVSRRELKIYQESGGESESQHSFIVVSDGRGGFKIAAMARGKQDETGKRPNEGILGHGSFGMAKIIQWQDGTRDAIKIEGAFDESFERLNPGASLAAAKEREQAEIEVMRKIGVLKGQFRQDRLVETEWIEESRIKDKKYTIQTLQEGEQGEVYLKKADVSKMGVDQKCDIAMKSAVAIQALHAENILHTDINARNFMIQMKDNGRVAVAAIDFGFALELKSGAESIKRAEVTGTPGYIAPEIYELDEVEYQGEKGFTPRGNPPQRLYSKKSDVYALGKMFERDLKLGTDDPGLKKLIEDMTHEDPKQRCSIENAIQRLTPYVKEEKQLNNKEKRANSIKEERDRSVSRVKPDNNKKQRSRVGDFGEGSDQRRPSDKQSQSNNRYKPYEYITEDIDQLKPLRSQEEPSKRKTLVNKVKDQIKGHLWNEALFKNLTLKSKDQNKIIQTWKVDFENILEQCELNENKKRETEETDRKIAQQVVILFKKNQNMHDKALLATASSFNLQLMQRLPDGLQKAIFQELGVPEKKLKKANKLLKGESYAHKRQFAKMIKEYEPSVDKVWSQESPSSRPQSPRVS